MKKIIVGFLLISGSILGQESGKSIAILGGPSQSWTKNRLTTKDENTSFTNLGLQYTSYKSSKLAIVLTTLAGFKGEFTNPGIWDSKHISAGANMRYFVLSSGHSGILNPFVQVGANASARRDVGFPGNAYELNAEGGLGVGVRITDKWSLIAQTNLAIPMAQSTEGGVAIGSVRGTNNSTSFGLVYHLGDSKAKKKEAAKKAAEDDLAKARAQQAAQQAAAQKADEQAKAEALAKAKAKEEADLKLAQQEKAAAEAKSEAIAATQRAAAAERQKVERFTSSSLTIILYMTNRWEIQETSMSTLHKIVSLMGEYPESKVEIMGHSDNFGSTENNQKVSKYRADGVAKFLKDQGIKANRMKISAFGETKPTASNQTKAGMSLNRRVEIKLIK